MVAVIFYDLDKNLISANKMDIVPHKDEIVHVDNKYYAVSMVIHKVYKNDEHKTSFVYLKPISVSEKFKN